MKSLIALLSVALCAALAATVFFYAAANTRLQHWQRAEKELLTSVEELTRLRAALQSPAFGASNARAQSQPVEPMVQRSPLPLGDNGASPSSTGQLLLHADSAPPLPVSVAKRYTVRWGNVLQIRNNSPSPIAIRAELANDTLRLSKTFDVVIEGEAIVEIGKREGWAGAPGDKIRVSSPGYTPLFKQL